ncbi:hypothetical protein DTO164E3_4497 [Paecilomyces variotii]|nr:hypothetical protein DTO164E3_4497 [Paecilomyces variotii]KAJ9203330.1 hypothetical protein DTO032I3_3197 [Paecilomyces variotii]KAJ9278933.1 hypothetical protein DTO021D3_4249 [Paecilomyces variotii]KAJ9343246.1 hypothetical protein DTO027B6_4170 [Paecilomyces variotii]KAJ9384721.1 hypothetical protein DTO032I4_4543 [Paecilomyces variotii]
MKQRFSSLDVKVITRELDSALTSLRVSNIYDLSSRIFLFKLAKPDNRKQLIVDSGFRCHLTEYSRSTATAPSPFVTRLRKTLKTRRVTSVTQIGTDRIIDIVFSDGVYHLFLEFFAGGNIILTDRDYTILTLFRQVPAGGDQEEVKVGLKYTVTNKQNYGGVPELSKDRVKETLQKAIASGAAQEAAKKSKKKSADLLRKALSLGFPEYPPLLLDHAFVVRGFDSTILPDQVLQDDGILEKLMGVLEEAESVSKQLSASDKHPGYIVAKEDKRPVPDSTAEKKTSYLYEDFHPFKPQQFEGKPETTVLEFDGFNKTVDEYFSSLESQKLESRLTEREEAARRKLEAVRQEHEKRLGTLQQAQEIHIRKAEAIEANVFRVQEAMDAVNGLIAQGMDWVEMARLIEMEQNRNNPVAKIIKLPLKLYENTVTLLLGEENFQQEAEDDEAYGSESESESEKDSEDEKQGPTASQLLEIDIDLGLSPWANATQYYTQKKVAAVKEQKTAQSSTKALKSHEKKVTEDLKKSLKQEKQVLRPARKPFWFEKYLFFISSEGYLVLGGRDTHQTEILYRRYLKKGDIFVHADLEGATPMIVKNRPGQSDAPIPPGTLSQAGNYSVATSVAWDSKAVMSAWWVHANQVSKTTETGELLVTGGFVIKGEKNFLAPSQLVLGFAVMFQVSMESVQNHRKHRLHDAEETPVTEQVAESETQKGESPSTETPAENPGDDKEQTSSDNDAGRADQREDSPESDEDDHLDEKPAENPLQSGASEPVEEGIKPENADEEESDDEEGSEKAEEHEKDQEAPEETGPTKEGQQESSRPQAGRRHLSAREKRLAKKGKPLDVPTASSDVADDASSIAADPPDPSTAPSVVAKSAALSRGKRAKAKKAAAKYADQDEEDRELALRLLGSTSKPNKAAIAAAEREKRNAEIEAQRERRRAQHNRAAEAERRRLAALEEGADDYDEETAKAEAADLSWLPALVGTPLPEDEVLAAIPVCAPWAALTRYKYRAKLQPGTVKKGKAVKEILGRWIAESTAGAKKGKKEDIEETGVDRATAERMRAREAELIKAWREAEIVNTVPVGKVRIITGGGSGGAGGGGGGGGGKGGEGKGKSNQKGGKGGKGGKKK